MIPAASPNRPPDDEPPGVPGFSSWKKVYLFVFGWFVVLVTLLAIFTRAFA